MWHLERMWSRPNRLSLAIDAQKLAFEAGGPLKPTWATLTVCVRGALVVEEALDEAAALEAAALEAELVIDSLWAETWVDPRSNESIGKRVRRQGREQVMVKWYVSSPQQVASQTAPVEMAGMEGGNKEENKESRLCLGA
jgi:hypothetical protein